MGEQNNLTKSKAPWAKRKIDEAKGAAKTVSTTLYEAEITAARKTFGSISKAVRWALQRVSTGEKV